MAAPDISVVSGDVVLTRTVCSFAGQVSMNVAGWTVGTVVAAGVTLLEIADDLDAFFSAVYPALLTNNAQYYGLGARKFVGQRLSLEFAGTANVSAGTGGATPLPTQTCGMVTKQSAVAGPAGRGRIYVPFPDASMNAAPGIPTAGYMTNLGLMAARYANPRVVVGAGGSVTLTPAIVRYPRPNLPTPILLGTTPWANATARQKWATHRTRGVYGRLNSLPF